MAQPIIVNQNTADNVVAGAGSASDMAHNMLSGIFGTSWDTLFSGANAGSIGNSWSALFTLFGYMNSVVMMGVSVMIFYVLSMGVIGTAHEGKALGARYSTLWTPLRSVFSVSLLMPLPGLSGISLLQGLLLLIISVGSYGANQMWSMSLDYMRNNQGSLVSGLSINEVSSAYEIANTVMSSEMAQVYFGMGAPSVTESVSNGTITSSATYTFSFNYPSDYPSLQNEMGKITLECHVKDSAICQARHEQILLAINSFFPTAQAIVAAETQVPADVISKYVTAYESAINTAVKSSITGTDADELNTALDAFVASGKAKGWVSAGSWYWTIAGLQEKSKEEIKNYPTSERLNEASVKGIGLNDYSVFKAALVEYLNKSGELISDQTIASNLYNAKGDTFWGKVSGYLSTPGVNIIELFTTALTSGDPISNLKVVGDTIIDVVGTIVGAVALGLTGTSALQGAASSWIESTFSAGAAPAAANALNTAATMAGVAAAMYALPLFMMGITLAYYLPAIPFILFTMGVLGWVILIFESLGAAPIWAAGHAMPEGEGMAGQHGKQGYMLFMNVLFRPPLMVLGFMATFSAMKVAAWLIGTTFMTYVSGATAGNIVGPVTILAMVAIMTMMVIQSANLIFGLINHLPDNVMRWIGGHGAQLGEQQSQGAVKAAFAAAAGTTMQTGGKALGDGMGQIQGAKDKDQKKQSDAAELEAGKSQKSADGAAFGNKMGSGSAGGVSLNKGGSDNSSGNSKSKEDSPKAGKDEKSL